MKINELMLLINKQFFLFKMKNNVKEEFENDYLTEARIIAGKYLSKDITGEEFVNEINSSFETTHSLMKKSNKLMNK